MSLYIVIGGFSIVIGGLIWWINDLEYRLYSLENAQQPHVQSKPVEQAFAAARQHVKDKT